MSILAENINTAVSDHEERLRFFLLTFDRLTFLSGSGIGGLVGQLARFYRSKRLFEYFFTSAGRTFSKTETTPFFATRKRSREASKSCCGSTLHPLDEHLCVTIRMLAESFSRKKYCAPRGLVAPLLADPGDLMPFRAKRSSGKCVARKNGQ